MGGLADSIGSIAVNITGDYSDLQAKLADAATEAQDGASKIQASFTAAAAGTDAWAQAVETLVGAGHTLGEAMALATANTAELTSASNEAGQAAQSAAEQLSLFAESAGVPFADASGQLNLFTDELEIAAPALQKVSAGAEEANKPIKDLEDNARNSGGALDGLAGSVVKLATQLGLIIGAKAFLTDTFQAFTQLQDATTAMTALTGSAALAAEQVQNVRDLATSENLSFPALLEATQRMDAFGISAGIIPDALEAAATAAVATNKSIDQTANALERMAAAGTVGGRQLATVGLTTHELAGLMGTLDSDVTKTFKDLDENTRLAIISMAEMDKRSSLLTDTAGNLSREWQGVKNQFTDTFQTLGEALKGPAEALLDWAKSVGKAMEAVVLAVQVNLEKAEFYIEKWTGQLDAANKKAEEINKNAAKFRALVTGEGGAPAGPPLRVFTQQGFAKEFNQDLKTENWEAATKLIEELGKTNLPAAQAAMKQLVEAEWEAADAAKAHHEQLDKVRGVLPDAGTELRLWIDEEKLEIAQNDALAKGIAKYAEEHMRAGENLTFAAATQGYFNEQLELSNNKIAKALEQAPEVGKAMTALGIGTQKAGEAQKDFGAIMTSAGISVDKALPPLDAFGVTLAHVQEALAKGDFAKAQTAIDKLAKLDLPAAVTQQDLLAAAVEKGHTSYEELTKVLQKQIDMHVQLGQSMNSEVIALTNIEERHKILTATTNIAGNAYKGLLQDINRFGAGLSHTLAVGIVEGQKFSQVWQQIWKSFAEAILQTVITALELLVVKHIAALLGITGTDKAAAASQISSQAGISFASAFASVMSSVPFPLNIGLAPAVAAAAGGLTESGGMGFLAAGSAAGGALLDRDMMVQAHAEEMILPASLSNGIQDLIQSNRSVGSAGNGLTIAIQNMHGVTRDTVDAMANAIVRKARLAGAFR